MRANQMARLKFFSLLFMLPGIAGLIISAMVSLYYMNTMPKFPHPEELRNYPRNINGYVVYQTKEEDLRLSVLEWTSVGVFVVGLGLGLVYLEKWGSRQLSSGEEDEAVTEA